MKIIPIRHITATSNSQSNKGKFSIRTLQQLLNGKDLVHPLHRHNFFFILAVQKGRGIHEIDFIEHAVQDNTIFILRPGQVHRLSLKAGATGFLLEFDLPFYQLKNSPIEQYWKKALSQHFCKAGAVRFMKMHSFLSSLLDEFTTKQEGYTAAIKATLDLFFIEYTRLSHNPKKIVKAESGYIQDRFDELALLLETNISHMKNVSEYANLLNLSPYQLNAITKASVGKTVSDLINGQIILEAKRYLLATPNQVKDIADLLGYEDASYFTRFFKKHTGHSPETFRKNFN